MNPTVKKVLIGSGIVAGLLLLYKMTSIKSTPQTTSSINTAPFESYFVGAPNSTTKYFIDKGKKRLASQQVWEKYKAQGFTGYLELDAEQIASIPDGPSLI